MRNRKRSKRELTNVVLYIVKTDYQWCQLPHDFPPYQTVYIFFSRGAKSGLWEKILARLVEKTRKDAGKSAEPCYALIDSQSVKTVADNEKRGIDGRKKQKNAGVMLSQTQCCADQSEGSCVCVWLWQVVSFSAGLIANPYDIETANSPRKSYVPGVSLIIKAPYLFCRRT